MKTKAEYAIWLTEDFGAWPRDIQAVLAVHGLPCVPYKAECEDYKTGRSITATIGYQFEDGSIAHDDFELSFDNEDAADEWYAEYVANAEPDHGHFQHCHDHGCVC